MFLNSNHNGFGSPSAGLRPKDGKARFAEYESLKVRASGKVIRGRPKVDPRTVNDPPGKNVHHVPSTTDGLSTGSRRPRYFSGNFGTFLL